MDMRLLTAQAVVAIVLAAVAVPVAVLAVIWRVDILLAMLAVAAGVTLAIPSARRATGGASRDPR